MSILRVHHPQELSVIGIEFGNDVPSKPGEFVKLLASSRYTLEW